MNYKFDEYSAGGFVIYKDQILLVKNKNDNNNISIPKGHIKSGESKIEAAKREIKEETGYYDLELVKELPSDIYSYERNGKLINKINYQFLFILKSLNRKDQSLEANEDLEVVLTSIKKAKKILSFKNVKDILSQIY